MTVGTKWSLEEACEAVLGFLGSGVVCPSELIATMCPDDGYWMFSIIESGLADEREIRDAIIELMAQQKITLDWDRMLSVNTGENND
jgi:hypothetical protein